MLSRRSIRNFMGLSGLEIYKSEEVSKKENYDESKGWVFKGVFLKFRSI